MEAIAAGKDALQEARKSRFLSLAIILDLVVSDTSIGVAARRCYVTSMTMASMLFSQSLSATEQSIGSKFPDNMRLLKAANATFLAGISVLSGHAMQKSWNFAVVKAMDSILSANWASQDLQASTFRQRLFRNIGEPPPCMFVIAGSYPSMSPPRTSSSSREVCTTLKTLPDDLQQTLLEAARVLKDNGAFFVVEPLVNYFLGLCPYSMSKQDR